MYKQKILLNNSLVKKEILIEIGNYLELNDNKNTTYKYLWDAAKVILKRQFIALYGYIKEKKIGNLQAKCPIQ